MSSSRSLLTLLNAVALGALTLGMATPAAAQVPFSRVNGQGCPAGSVLLSFAEANANRDAACRVLQTWDIARLADGGSMDGPGYGCKTRPSDTRALGNALCKPAPPPEHLTAITKWIRAMDQVPEPSADLAKWVVQLREPASPPRELRLMILEGTQALPHSWHLAAQQVRMTSPCIFAAAFFTMSSAMTRENCAV